MYVFYKEHVFMNASRALVVHEGATDENHPRCGYILIMNTCELAKVPRYSTGCFFLYEVFDQLQLFSTTVAALMRVYNCYEIIHCHQ